MATSASTNFTETRDSIITRSLRICSAVGQGETPTTSQISESAQALNDIIKSMIADGMQLWHRANITITPIASTATYVIGAGAATNAQAPLKIIEAFYRNTSSGADTPIMLITKNEYDRYSIKSQTGTPNQIYYEPPGATTGEMTGTLFMAPVPDATFVAGYTVRITALTALMDFDASTDNPDFPSYYYNAIVWKLASELAYENGVPLSERAMIAKRAVEEHANAMSFDIEEGSFYIQPASQYYR